MAVWIVVFFLLFALAQFFDWIKGFSFPLPLSILAGVVLAIASNYQRLAGSFIPDSLKNDYISVEDINNNFSHRFTGNNQEVLPENSQNSLPDVVTSDGNKNS